MRHFLIASMLCLVACGSSSSSPTGDFATPAAGLGGGTASGSGSSGASGGTPNGSGTDSGAGQAGVLTAGLWDDNLNYDFFTKYQSGKTSLAGNPGLLSSDYDASHASFAARTPNTIVDAALVLDTTGSMGDEIAYLTAEFASISSTIAAAYPNAQQRWALVAYRDRPDTDPGDDYVVRSYDFTADMQAFAQTIGSQTAANGGDYPESPDLGLEQLKQLSWRSGPGVAKVAFWVADAPDHVERAADMKQAIVDTRNLGVHVYPVSASGTDDLLELSMRSAAQITGGRYGFLTDDSGIGDPHKIPEIPCYFVTRLEKGLLRAIGMELSGAYVPPAAADVLRTAGSPAANGTCTTQDGQTVQIF